jgi:hypothetical protein
MLQPKMSTFAVVALLAVVIPIWLWFDMSLEDAEETNVKVVLGIGALAFCLAVFSRSIQSISQGFVFDYYIDFAITYTSFIYAVIAIIKRQK